MLLQYSTWQEIEGYLKRSQTILIPLGSVEQHGPTGLIGTDFLCPQTIAAEAEREADLLIAPSFSVGVAQHHLAFPGTLTLRPSTFIAVVQDWIQSLSRHGFKRLYFLNGHGGNIPPFETALAEIYTRFSFRGVRPPFMAKLRNWWDLEGVTQLTAELFPAGHGSHATPSEIAITQWAFPESMKYAQLSPPVAAAGPILDALDYRQRCPDGRMGSDPLQATPEAGERIVKAAVAGLLKDIELHWV